MIEEKQILVVEDDEDTRYLYVEVLQAEGYRILEASDGLSALTVLKDNPSVSLILLDLTMPGLPPAEFFRLQKEAQGDHPIPVITISGRSDTKAQAESLGANDFLLKPFDIDHLVSKVKDWAYLTSSHSTH